MNFLSKLIVFLIFTLSVIFLGVSVIAFSTHKNWMKVEDNAEPQPGEQKGLKQQIAHQTKANAALEAERDRMIKDYDNEVAGRRFVLASLAAKLYEDVQRLETAQADLIKLQQSSADAAAELRQNSDKLAALTKTVADLRTQIANTKTQMNQRFDSAVNLVEEVNRHRDLLRRMKEKEAQLALRLQTMLAAKKQRQDAPPVKAKAAPVVAKKD